MFTTINKEALAKAYTEAQHLRRTMPGSVAFPATWAADALRDLLAAIVTYEEAEKST